MSWALAWLAGGIVVGVWCAQYASVLVSPLLFVLLIILAAYLVWRARRLTIGLLVGIGVLLGLARGAIDQRQLDAYVPLYHQVVRVQGKLIEDPQLATGNQLALVLSEIVVGAQPYYGSIRITVSEDMPVLRGDTVVVEGVLLPGFGTFAASLYRATVHDITRPQPGDVGRVVRDWFARHVRLVIDEPQASLGLGFLLGQKSALPPELAEALQITGLTHIVVASGFNLTILVRFARRAFMRVSRYSATIAAAGMVAAFMAITGLSPSMSRAGLVAGLSLVAWYYGRQFHPVVLLLLAAAVTVIVQPSYAWGDVGWQLSFAAFAGVMLFAPLLQAYFFGDKKPGMIRQLLGETVAAYLVTLPILIVTFGTVSFVAIIANLLVVPFVPLAMLGIFVVGMLASILPVAGDFFSATLEMVLGYMVAAADFLAALPWAQMEVTVPPWTASLLYAAIGAIGVYVWRITKKDLRAVNIIE